MKKIIMTWFAVVLSMAFATGALAGNSGGGGGAILCNANNPALRTAKLLEFWEAENGLKPFAVAFEIERSDAPVFEQIDRAMVRLKKVNPYFAGLVEKTLHEKILWPNTISVPGFHVIAPTDSLQPFFPEGCERVGIGSYSDLENQLSYDEEYLSYMSNTDQAGFWLHEAIYKTIRDSLPIRSFYPFEHNSVETRVLVAKLFAKNQKLASLSEKPNDSVASYECSRAATRPTAGGPDMDIIPEIRFYMHKFFKHLEIVPTFIMPTGASKDLPLPQNYGEHFFFAERVRLTENGTEYKNLYLKSKYVAMGLKLYIVVEEEPSALFDKVNGDIFYFNAAIELALDWMNTSLYNLPLVRMDSYQIACRKY